MRIACIAGTDLRTDRRARAHARALAAAGHDVALFGVLSRGAEPEEDDGPVVLVRTPLPGWDRERAPGAAWRAARWVRRYDRVARAAVARGPFDAYHAFGIDVAGPAAQAAQGSGALFVLDDPGASRLDLVARRVSEMPVGARRGAAELVVDHLRRGEDRLQRTVRAAAHAVIASSRAVAEDARSRWGGPVATVVHDAFVAAPRRKAERLRKRLGVYPDDRVVVVREETPAAVAAARALHILGDGHLLVLVGWTRLAPDVVGRAEREGLARRVRVLPPAPEAEVLELCAGADAAVLPLPAADRLARLVVPPAFYEHLAARVPVVAPDVPGVGGLVRATGAGVLYPGRVPTDPGALAEALRTILADRSLAETCRDRAARAMTGDLGWERQQADLAAAYAALAATA